MPHFSREPLPKDSFDFAVIPASNHNAIPVDLDLVLINDVSGNYAIPVDLELVLINDVSGSVANNKYDLKAVHDGDRKDFAEATTEFTGDYIL